MPKYRTVVDGQWTPLDWNNQKEACCNCSLIHRVDYKVIKGQLFAKFRVDKRATSAMRRKTNNYINAN